MKRPQIQLLKDVFMLPPKERKLMRDAGITPSIIKGFSLFIQKRKYTFWYIALAGRDSLKGGNYRE